MSPTRIALSALALFAVAATPAAAKPYDLNADGRQDAVVGLPWWNVPRDGTGAVAVIEGSRSRTFGTGHLITRDRLGLTDSPPTATRTGTGIASGDFDGDGDGDLAIGTPGEGDTGAVSVLYGSRAFPEGRTATFLGPVTGSQQSQQFGHALVAGDLNRDGFDDLAASDIAADTSEGAYHGSGAVYLLYGSAVGLGATGWRKIDRPRESYNTFGIQLALGDTNRDRHLDLFEGFEGEQLWGDDDPVPGHFSIARGTKSGPMTAERVRGDLRGGPTSMAPGDVNGDRYPDVVLGVPVDDYVNPGTGDRVPPGSVRIFVGGPTHVIARPAVISQGSRGVPGSNEPGDQFGSSVAVGRIDGDRYADIVVGARGEDNDRGRVTVIRGGPARRAYSRKRNFAFDPSTRGLPGRRERGSGFGGMLSLVDLTGDGRRDLIVGAPYAVSNTGTIWGLPGVKGGLSRARAHWWKLRSFGYRIDPRTGPHPEMRLGRAGSSS
jgi:hypothetical protein